jgi:uncharacterized protein (DUF4415 family)
MLSKKAMPVLAGRIPSGRRLHSTRKCRASSENVQLNGAETKKKRLQMSNDRQRRPADPWKNAEAVFKPAASKPATTADKHPLLPGVKETVSLRIDQDVLEHYRSEGPGWQDRINAVLREASNIGKG